MLDILFNGDRGLSFTSSHHLNLPAQLYFAEHSLIRRISITQSWFKLFTFRTR